MEVIKSYFNHLSQTPERIDSLLLWTLCTFVCWSVLVVYRKSILKGLEGVNMLFEGGEIVTFIALWCFPPGIFYVLFFTENYMRSVYIVDGIAAYQITGRYIFDWALAIRTGSKITEVSQKTSESETKVTKTEVKEKSTEQEIN